MGTITKKIKVCDYCGNPSGGDIGAHIDSHFFRKGTYNYHTHGSLQQDKEEFELCPECENKIINFLKKG